MKKLKLFLLIIFGFILISTLPKKTYASLRTSASSATLTSLYTKQGEDNRVKILKNFLLEYNSPLAEYAHIFVKEADKNGLDWRLLVSISGVESAFGKRIPPYSYNGWGWGIYGGNVLYFKSWEKAIETISESIRKNYIDKWGAKNIFEIGRIYASDPMWAYKVTYFMNQIEKFEKKQQKQYLSLSL